MATKKSAASSSGKSGSSATAQAASTSSSASLALTSAQNTFLASLSFPAAQQLQHLAKTSTDVGTAFGATVLSTISGSASLGGAAQVTAIQALLTQQQQLLAIQQVLAPAVRLVDQNLLLVDAELADAASAAVKQAKSLSKKQPQLLQGLDAAVEWIKKHHPGKGKGKSSKATASSGGAAAGSAAAAVAK